MSEAMSNREIEDVLSSIRRLVAQEARPQPERLVLTAAQRVGGPGVGGAEVGGPEPLDASSPAIRDEAPSRGAGVSGTQDEPATEAPAGPPVAPPVALAVEGHAALEATISELESALGSGSGTGPEFAPGLAGDWPGQDAAASDTPTPGAPGAEGGAAWDDNRGPQAHAAPPPPEDDATLIDEDELGRMIARLVREELRGQLGEKITLQVRKLVRAEIARALDERKLLG